MNRALMILLIIFICFIFIYVYFYKCAFRPDTSAPILDEILIFIYVISFYFFFFYIFSLYTRIKRKNLLMKTVKC